MMHFDQIKP